MLFFLEIYNFFLNYEIQILILGIDESTISSSPKNRKNLKNDNFVILDLHENSKMIVNFSPDTTYRISKKSKNIQNHKKMG